MPPYQPHTPQTPPVTPEQAAGAPLQPYQPQPLPPPPQAAPGQAWGPQPGYPPQTAQTQSAARVLAIVGLVMAFLLAPVGLVLCIIALAKKPDPTSKILSIIGLVISALAVVVAGLLLAIVFSAVPKLQQNSQDVKQKNDLNVLTASLSDAYTSSNGVTYPSLEQLNDERWRDSNMKGLDPLSLSPNSSVTQLASSPNDNQYGYVPAPDGCQGTAVSPCKSFTLSTTLHDGQPYSVSP